MALKVECVCGKKLSIKDELAGRRLKCPACDQTFTAPLAEPEGTRKSRPKDRGEENRPAQGTTARPGMPQGRSSRDRGPHRDRGPRVGAAGRTQGKSSSGKKRGLLIGLSVGIGLLAVAAVAVMRQSTQPEEATSIVTQGSEVKNLADADGVGLTDATEAVNSGSPPPMNAAVASPVAAMSETSPSPSPPKNASNSADDLKLLQGKWQITDFAMDLNQPAPQVMRDEMTRTTWTIEGSSLLVSSPAVSSRATLLLDASQTPGWLDINKLDGPTAGKPGRAVYSLQGDTLKVCMSLDGAVRPKEIMADLAQAQIVFTLVRSKESSGQ